MSITATLTDRTDVRATKVFPRALGGQQHVILHFSQSEVTGNPRNYLPLANLKESVLGSAYYSVRTLLPTLLPEPYDQIPLPVLPREELREERVFDEDGRLHGKLIQVPGLYVHANRILANTQQENTQYNYLYALGRMAFEAARLFASLTKRHIYRVRQQPGAMATIIGRGELAHDEIGISQEFAGDIFRSLRKMVERKELTPQILDLVPTAERLDNFPAWGIRFPLANQHGIQPMHLKVLPGKGRYVGFNPWNLGLRFLGDEDGDPGFFLVRLEEVLAGSLTVPNRPRILPSRFSRQISSRLSLQDTLTPEAIPGISTKQLERMRGLDLTTEEKRLNWILEADARQHVAVYTMCIGWYAARVLVLAGYQPQEAHRMAYEALEHFMELCMDRRKGGQELGNFDEYRFMDSLLRGGSLDWAGLQGLGVPEKSLQVLQTAWTASSGHLRNTCGTSPVYTATILQRNGGEQATHKMLQALRGIGVHPADLYRVMVDDLCCLNFAHWPGDALIGA
jgi:hypothetical protein